jgi:hypothetical protein
MENCVIPIPGKGVIFRMAKSHVVEMLLDSGLLPVILRVP